MEKIDCAVIGAGVIGLAVARLLALSGREVIMLEAENRFGSGISARNSEVIHAGIYYPKGSLKAELCVAGRNMLYRYTAERGVDHKRCGKLIVATSEAQKSALMDIAAHASANGVEEIRTLSRHEARALEPDLECVAALFSPATGIIDSHGLMNALLGDAQAAGALLALQSPVIGGELTSAGIILAVGGAEPMDLLAKSVFNCAGLGAQGVARSLKGMPVETVPPLHYAKGNYYALAGRSPFTHLVYPVPQPGGLGVHLTLDLAGAARFGPDVEWIEEINYAVDPGRADGFYAEIRRYWPGLPDGALSPAYAGIRPKPHAPGEAAVDFLVHGRGKHGIEGLVCLYGIESPGLTSCLALAEHVLRQ